MSLTPTSLSTSLKPSKPIRFKIKPKSNTRIESFSEYSLHLSKLSTDLFILTLRFLDTNSRAALMGTCREYFFQRRKSLRALLTRLDERDSSAQTKFTGLCKLQAGRVRYIAQKSSFFQFCGLRAFCCGIKEAQFTQIMKDLQRMKRLIVEYLINDRSTVKFVLIGIDEHVEQYVPQNIQILVLAELREAAFQAFLEMYSAELFYDLGCQRVSTDAEALCTDLTAIQDHADSAANIRHLKTLVVEKYPKGVEVAREKLIQVCNHSDAFYKFLDDKRRPILRKIEELQKEINACLQELIQKLNQPLKCDLCAGSPNQGKVVEMLPGLRLKITSSYEDVERVMMPKIAELEKKVEQFERYKRNEYQQILHFIRHARVDLSALEIRQKIPSSFIEYQKDWMQLRHLQQLSGFQKMQIAMKELKIKIAKLEAELLYVRSNCLTEIEARRRSLDLLASPGDGFLWPQEVSHFEPPPLEELRDKTSEKDEKKISIDEVD